MNSSITTPKTTTPAPYQTPVGTPVTVTFTDGRTLDMVVHSREWAGAMGTSHATGDTFHAHTRPGGYGISWGGRTTPGVLSVVLAPAPVAEPEEEPAPVDITQPLDVWLRFADDADGADEDDLAEYEANTFHSGDGDYIVKWYHTAVGQVSSRRFATLAEAYAFLAGEGFEDYSS